MQLEKHSAEMECPLNKSGWLLELMQGPTYELLS